MRLVFFTHPAFLNIKSINRFTQMLAGGMEQRGHHVIVWKPKPFFWHQKAPALLQKWLGYLDQYLVFPYYVRNNLKKLSADTLFVFTDQAQGPWVSLVRNRPHVIHCHDFLAQRSAKNEFLENPANWFGRIYQQYIRRGYSKGKNFIAVSEKTQEDLHLFLRKTPRLSQVIYNGLNEVFAPAPVFAAQARIANLLGKNLGAGYLLHVGGNSWYKNKAGVLDLYQAWRGISQKKLPLLMIGEKPNKVLLNHLQETDSGKDVFFLDSLCDTDLCQAYAGAVALLFPSLAEGFGWPIAEAMACGCPVITTDMAPMTEVGGTAAWYIRPYPRQKAAKLQWAQDGAQVIERLVQLSEPERKVLVAACLQNASRFKLNHILDQVAACYEKIVQEYLAVFGSKSGLDRVPGYQISLAKTKKL